MEVQVEVELGVHYLGVRCKYLLGEHSAPPLHPTCTRHLNILKEQNENSLGGF